MSNLISTKTFHITSLSHDGRGVARDEQKVVFIQGALPQEKVEAQITKRHRQFDEARCVKVLEPVSYRVEPVCPHFGICGGCQLQHVDPLKQIEYKQTSLQEQLQQIQVEPTEWLPPLTQAFFGYRQKARLGVRYVDKKNALLIGFREQNSNKITLTESCAILDPRVGEAFEALKEVIKSLQAMRHIPQIEVAIGGEEVALVFRHLEPLCEADQEKLIAFAKKQAFTLFLQPGSPDTVHSLWPPAVKKMLSYTLCDQSLRFEFHPLDFTQVNAAMNQSMINQALDRLSPNKDHVVLDLFCGLGNFSLPLAQQVHHVVGVEGSAGMVERAKSNAKLNKIENVEFYTADLEGEWKTQPFVQKKYHSLLLDPPRSGARSIVENIHYLNVDKILYISCNPSTFVRDVAVLVHQKGYRLLECGVMDMFPHTAHVETMGLLVKENG